MQKQTFCVVKTAFYVELHHFSFCLIYNKNSKKYEGDTVNVKFEMVSNPGIVGYAYAQAKDCKDAGTVFSITFKINRENEKELTYESVYIDEFDTCDSNLEDVNTDIKVQFSDKNADKNAQNKQNLQNTPEEQAGVKGQSDSINKSDSMDKSDSKNNETLKDTNSDGGKNENISKDINGTEENSVSLIEVNSSDTVKSTNIVIVIVIAAFLSLCLIATTVIVSAGNAFAGDANV